MASPGQNPGACGCLMAGFDKHAHCARCRDKAKSSDPCVNIEDCPHYNILALEQKLQLSMPSYQKKKAKCEQKSDKSDKHTRSEKSEDVGDTLIDPSLVSVIGAATSDKKDGEVSEVIRDSWQQRKTEEKALNTWSTITPTKTYSANFY